MYSDIVLVESGITEKKYIAEDVVVKQVELKHWHDKHDIPLTPAEDIQPLEQRIRDTIVHEYQKMKSRLHSGELRQIDAGAYGKNSFTGVLQYHFQKLLEEFRMRQDIMTFHVDVQELYNAYNDSKELRISITVDRFYRRKNVSFSDRGSWHPSLYEYDFRNEQPQIEIVDGFKFQIRDSLLPKYL
jgi:hypothetical protein